MTAERHRRVEFALLNDGDAVEIPPNPLPQRGAEQHLGFHSAALANDNGGGAFTNSCCLELIVNDALIDADALALLHQPQLARCGSKPGEVVGFHATFPDGFA